jgi:hypothetical protein
MTRAQALRQGDEIDDGDPELTPMYRELFEENHRQRSCVAVATVHGEMSVTPFRSKGVLYWSFIMLKIADYAREESRKAGATRAQFKAGITLVKEALHTLDRIDYAEIEVTKHPDFAVWLRLKWSVGQAASFRAIVELQGDAAILHVVLPRTSSTYDEVEALWKKHRTQLEADGDN